VSLYAQEMVNTVDAEYVHLPDHEFADWCFAQYGLNKGIYNTLDKWFYNHGVKKIVERRTTIVSFLEYAQTSGVQKNSKQTLKFGKGGLNHLLEQFHVYAKINVPGGVKDGYTNDQNI